MHIESTLKVFSDDPDIDVLECGNYGLVCLPL